ILKKGGTKMIKKVKVIAVFAILLIATTAFLGCVGPKEEIQPAEKLVIEFWTTENEKERVDVQNKIAEQFEKANPNLEIKIVLWMRVNFHKK
ncbi:MAG: hypothetical protein ACE5J3_13435, partial [Methanosarcinales archaeon]